MRRFIFSALLLASASPVLAQMPPPASPAPPADVRDQRRDAPPGVRPDDRRPDDRRPDDRGPRPDDRRDGREDERRDFRQDERRDYRQDERRDERRDYRQDERRDFRQDERRDFRRDGRDFRQDERRDFRDDRRAYGDQDRFARFHADRFYYPRGYGYRYYGIGAILPRVFWSQRYYIAQPAYYRLPPAFAGTRWVRVGPDALLIRNYDGRVVRAIQGLFY